MDEVQVDVEQVGLSGFMANQVLLPNLVGHGSSLLSHAHLLHETRPCPICGHGV